MKIVTLGEIMLRLSTPGNTRFVQSDSFDVVYGGGEANVAVSCANYGHEAYFVSKLPKHEIGQSAVNALRKYGVRTDFIARGGDRVGIYYLETGRFDASLEGDLRPCAFVDRRGRSAGFRLRRHHGGRPTGSTGRASRPRSRTRPPS